MTDIAPQLETQAVAQMIIQNLIASSNAFCTALLNSTHQNQIQSSANFAGGSRAIEQLLKSPEITTKTQTSDSKSTLEKSMWSNLAVS